MKRDRLNIAVIGAGVAGIGAAQTLSPRHEVTLIERNDYVGGHTNTVTIPDGPDAGTPVDTGFIVCNNRNYPTFLRFLDELGVERRNTDMSFSFHDETSGFCYNGEGLNALFAQRKNLLDLSFWKMLSEILRFNREGRNDLRADSAAGISLGDYLRRGRFAGRFVNQYVLPMGAAIWSTPANQMLQFPAESFLRFFENHGLLDVANRPQWMYIQGGSQQYVQAFLRQFKGCVETNAKIECVRRGPHGPVVRMHGSDERLFDRVVVATHADEAFRLLADPTPDEKRLLGPWEYSKNIAVFHSDASVMPRERRAWASWNYTREAAAPGDANEGPVSLTYDMTRLQRLQARNRYFVSLNRRKPIPEAKTIATFHYTHPQYTLASMATQKELPTLNGPGGTYFCGSYFGWGFHEDAIKSGVAAARTILEATS